MSIGQKTFIELNRRFRRLEQAASPERNAAASYRSLFEGDSTLDWEDILRRNRVVILGEAGSGKTEEFQNRTRLLADANEAAFFVRLDRLAAEPLHAILSTDQLKRFEQWKRGSELGTFFLDAVDEAKFHRLSDFYTALDRLKAALGRYELARARIILSSRISEWQPANDEYKFNGRFPAPKIERENESEDNSRETPDQALLVVQLEPLDKEQVKLFAISQGVSSVSQFIEALDQNHAWEFARRPLDVLELLFFWNENGKLGSLTEIIELDVQSKLMPRAEKDEHPLSYEEARTGAEWLAAASLFSRKFVFKVPEDIPSGAALDPRRCVPTLWNLQQCRTLLGRALFDSATYGRIRFHHRAVAEYLAAKWLTERIEEGCPIYELEQILTTITKGERIIRPSLSAIAAWLCCGSEPWNKAVRDWVIRAEPGIHLVYGDPARLPVDYRRQVLRALSQRSRDRKYERLDATTEALSRLAHLDLSGDIARLVSDASLTDAMRIQLLQIIFYGRLRGCLTAVLDIIADASTSEFLKRYGAFTVREIGNENELKRLAEIADSMSEIPERLCSIIATALFPKAIDARQLVGLIRKASFEGSLTRDLESGLGSHFKSTLTPAAAGVLLEELVTLAQQPPLLEDPKVIVPLSEKFAWVCRRLPTVLEILFQSTNLSENARNSAAEAVWLLDHFKEHYPTEEPDLTGLRNETSRHPDVRRDYFWRVIDEVRKQKASENNLHLYMFHRHGILSLEAADFFWLLDDAGTRKASNDSSLALRTALRLWMIRGRSRSDRKRILKAISSHEFLLSIFRSFEAEARFQPFRWARTLYFRSKLSNPVWRRIQIRRLKVWWNSMLFNAQLFCRQRLLASGEPVRLLADLLAECRPKHNAQFTPVDWTALGRKRRKSVARAIRRGCKAAWSRFTPELRHEKPNPSTVDCRVLIGLAGIQASLEDGELAFSALSDEGSERATRYALSELNGFAPWFNELASAQPSYVSNVLCTCIQAEWKAATEYPGISLLHDLVWSGAALLPLIQREILNLLQAGDPPTESALRHALVILTCLQDPPFKELVKMASDRIPHLSDPIRLALWSAVWVQIDANAAIAALRQKIAESPVSAKAVVLLCATLSGDFLQRAPLLRSPDYMRPAALCNFIPFVYSHVRTADDISRAGKGVFHPEARDYAQRFRSVLLPKLAEADGADVTNALASLAHDDVMADVRDWILDLMDQRLKRAADLAPWTPDDLRNFAERHEIDPKTDSELFSISVKRLRDIKNDIELADTSLRTELRANDREAELRKWLQRKLRERSRQRYTVPQEEEIDLQERPDLRVERPGMGPVSIEVKWAERWTLEQLLERLENQLVGQYLRAHDSRYGIYILGTIGPRDYWVEPDTRAHLTFEEVVDAVTKRALDLAKSSPEIGDLTVISLDFRQPRRT